MLSNKEITRRQIFYKGILPKKTFDTIQNTREWFLSIGEYKKR